MFITLLSSHHHLLWCKNTGKGECQTPGFAHKAPIECKMREMTTIGRIFKSHKSNHTLTHPKNKKINIFNHKIFLGYGLFKA